MNAACGSLYHACYIYTVYIRGIQHGEHARLFLFALINALLGVPR